MNILILGGTKFVGRAIVQAFLSQGHTVTLFHRGLTGAGLFAGQVERICGDRNSNLAQLANSTFDAVIDTCAYRPSQVAVSIKHLAGSCNYYLLISTISVYAAESSPIDESSPLKAPLWDEGLPVDGETYGGLKVACEQTLLESAASFSGGICVVRPGLVAGPHDHTDRFTSWLVKADQGQRIIAPDDEDAKCQFIDVRDLGDFVLSCVENGTTGVYNATGPEHELGFIDFLRTTQSLVNPGSKILMIPSKTLIKAGVEAWADLPLYSSYGPSERGIDQVSSLAARRAGLRHRPIAATILDTIEWFRSERSPDSLRAGLSSARTIEILDGMAVPPN